MSDGALRSDHVHEAARTALLPHRDGRWWDGSHDAMLKSSLGHHIAWTLQQVRTAGDGGIGNLLVMPP